MKKWIQTILSQNLTMREVGGKGRRRVSPRSLAILVNSSEV